MLKLFLLFHLVISILAGEFTFNHFINPPADPRVELVTSNNVVSFDEGTTATLKWVTTFKLSSLALLPLGANPLESKTSAAFITRNFTRTAVVWAVAPPPGMQPGVYFLQLFEEGGVGNFPSHNFTINVNVSASSTSETSATPTASHTTRLTTILSTSPTNSQLSSTMASTDTTTIAGITSSDASASFSFFTTSSAAAPSGNDPAIAETSSLSSTTYHSSSRVFASTAASATVESPSTIPASTTSPATFESQSSSSSTFSSSTLDTTPGSTTLSETQPMMMIKEFTKPEKLAVIIVPTLIFVVAALAYLAYRHLTRRGGVEAMMAKSLKVKEMPFGDVMNSQWRDTVVNKHDHSLQPWWDDRWRKLMWWKRS